MKKLMILLCMVGAIFAASSCKDMDDNYDEYLADMKTYSPRVDSVKAVSPEAGSLTLTFYLPKSPLAKSMRIVAAESSTQADTINIPQLVSEYTLTNLKLQSYQISVYTIDAFGNLSIPVTNAFTPVPGREDR